MPATAEPEGKNKMVKLPASVLKIEYLGLGTWQPGAFPLGFLPGPMCSLQLKVYLQYF